MPPGRRADRFAPGRGALTTLALDTEPQRHREKTEKTSFQPLVPSGPIAGK